MNVFMWARRVDSQFSFYSALCNDIDLRSLQRLGDDDLLFNALLKVMHMGDDADEAFAVGQVGQNLQGIAQGIVVQRAETLVDEHGFHANRAALGLYDVGQAQGQGQAGQEGLLIMIKTNKKVK